MQVTHVLHDERRVHVSGTPVREVGVFELADLDLIAERRHVVGEIRLVPASVRALHVDGKARDARQGVFDGFRGFAQLLV